MEKQTLLLQITQVQILDLSRLNIQQFLYKEWLQ